MLHADVDGLHMATISAADNVEDVDDDDVIIIDDMLLSGAACGKGTHLAGLTCD